jgi:DNA-binding transcriptional LysR family regulator
MDRLSGIKAFLEVVGSGSFVAAAERLDVSTATVSKHVMHLEQRLGARLLNRNSRSLSPTGLVARPVRSLPFLVAASRDYLRRNGAPKSPEELSKHDCRRLKSHSQRKSHV